MRSCFYPILLGTGKRFFSDGAPGTRTRAKAASSGVVISNLQAQRAFADRLLRRRGGVSRRRRSGRVTMIIIAASLLTGAADRDAPVAAFSADGRTRATGGRMYRPACQRRPSRCGTDQCFRTHLPDLVARFSGPHRRLYDSAFSPRCTHGPPAAQASLSGCSCAAASITGSRNARNSSANATTS